MRNTIGLALAVFAALSISCNEPASRLRLATTTSVDNSGLLEAFSGWRRIVEQARSAGVPAIVVATHNVPALEGLPMNVVQLPRPRT